MPKIDLNGKSVMILTINQIDGIPVENGAPLVNAFLDAGADVVVSKHFPDDEGRDAIVNEIKAHQPKIDAILVHNTQGLEDIPEASIGASIAREFRGLIPVVVEDHPDSERHPNYAKAIEAAGGIFLESPNYSEYQESPKVVEAIAQCITGTARAAKNFEQTLGDERAREVKNAGGKII